MLIFFALTNLIDHDHGLVRNPMFYAAEECGWYACALNAQKKITK